MARKVSINENESTYVYEIPQNVADNGKIAGVITWRSMLETMIVAAVIIVLCLKVFNGGILLTIFLCGMEAIFMLMPYGKNEDSLTTYLYLRLKNRFGKKTYRHYVTYKKNLTKAAQELRKKEREEAMKSFEAKRISATEHSEIRGEHLANSLVSQEFNEEKTTRVRKVRRVK